MLCGENRSSFNVVPVSSPTSKKNSRPSAPMLQTLRGSSSTSTEDIPSVAAFVATGFESETALRSALLGHLGDADRVARAAIEQPARRSGLYPAESRLLAAGSERNTTLHDPAGLKLARALLLGTPKRSQFYCAWL